VLILFSCNSGKQEPEQLAKQYCSSCHAFPEPSLLDKKTWANGVLPQMAFRMGMDYGQLQTINPDEVSEVIKVLPSQAMVSEEQWNAIKDFYLQHAPDSLPEIASKELPVTKQFSVSEFKLPQKTYPLITLVRYDSVNENIFIGTRLSKLYQLSANFILQDSTALSSPPADIIFQPDKEILLACLGIMDPNDQAKGTLTSLKSKEQTVLIDSIKRPVNVQKTDLNNDGQDDFVVAAFGNYTGALLAYEKSRSGYIRHVIHSFSGTRKTIIKDFNGDGLNDVLALITQGDEQIVLFTNTGNFKFRVEVLLRFSPVYGSSYFDLFDFNNDGKPDILYTNGDNADYSPIFKPYHGVRIFLNDGRNKFNEHWFYPMHGASQALARDFDNDGDLDIAAISFFPDFKKHPEQSFLYFENDNGKLLPSVTPLAASGRWLVMEAADIDKDGDSDLLLGALDFTAQVPESLLTQWRTQNTAVLILRNNQQ
jgi:hypothetical protein